MQQRILRKNKLDSASASRQYFLQVSFSKIKKKKKTKKPSETKHFKVAIKSLGALNVLCCIVPGLNHYSEWCAFIISIPVLL